MKRSLRLGLILLLCLPAMPALARLDAPHRVQDPAYGQILYAYFQQQYFPALTTTLIALDNGALPTQRDRARVMLGVLYLAYDMPGDAEALFDSLLTDDLDPALATRVWIHLADLYYRQHRPALALSVLDERISVVPADQREPYHALRSRILMQLGRFDETADALARLASDSRLGVYLQYNLAVSRINAGDGEAGLLHLRELTALPPGDPEINAIKDKALLALAVHHLRNDEPAQAAYYMGFARLDGPNSELSLLLHARAALAQGTPEKAVGSLQQLSERAMQHIPVQEASLLLPVVYEQLGDQVAAEAGYRRAISGYTGHYRYLGELAARVQAGSWFEELLGEVPWSTAMEPLPNLTPQRVESFETFHALFASHAFHSAWRNYHELLRQSRLLAEWRGAVPALQELLAAHRHKHADRVPAAQALLTNVADAALHAQLDDLFARLDSVVQENDWRALATDEERRVLTALDEARALAEKWGERVRPAARQRLALYEGLIAWDMQHDQVPRQWQQRKALNEARGWLAETDALSARVQHAAADDAGRLTAYQASLDELVTALDTLDARGAALMQRQQQAIQQLALAWIEDARPRLDQLAAQAWMRLSDLQAQRP